LELEPTAVEEGEILRILGIMIFSLSNNFSVPPAPSQYKGPIKCDMLRAGRFHSKKQRFEGGEISSKKATF